MTADERYRTLGTDTAATDLAIFKCRQLTPKIFSTNHKRKHFI